MNCSASNQVNYDYTLIQTITLTIPACVGDLGKTTGTLTPIGTPAPPSGFAVLSKNTDGSWKITIKSSDLTIAGRVFPYQLVFSDSSGAIVTQPTSPYFAITVVNPCLTTTLMLPTTLTDTTITSLSGVPTLQKFLPATDTASTAAGVAGFCGPHVYSIVEATPQRLVSIVAPATNLFTSNWNLSMLSNHFIDVGVWIVTLQAKL